MCGEAALSIRRTLQGILSAPKGDKKGIALCGHFIAVPSLDGDPQNLVVFCQHAGVLITQFIEQVG
jgi:hypothetical protein